MKTNYYTAIVNLPTFSSLPNSLINPFMYELQNQKIILEALTSDPDYHFIDTNIYYFSKLKKKWIVKKSNLSIIKKLLKDKTPFCDGCMWHKDWLKNIELTK